MFPGLRSFVVWRENELSDESRGNGGEMGIAMDKGCRFLHRGGGDDGIGIGQAEPRLFSNIQRGGDDILGDRQRAGKKPGRKGVSQPY